MDMKLCDVPVNEYTSSELLRLVLRPNDQYDTASVATDDSDDDDVDQDLVVSCGVLNSLPSRTLPFINFTSLVAMHRDFSQRHVCDNV